jgi:biopolymer transport protein ExbD
MRLDRQQKTSPEIDLGSFADIAFLLIIFFILTTTFLKPAGEPVEVPAGQTGEQQEEKQPTVNIAADGALLFNDDPVDLEELKRALQDLNLPNREPDRRSVILDVAPEVPYDRYFDVVMIISRAGGVVAQMEYAPGEES